MRKRRAPSTGWNRTEVPVARVAHRSVAAPSGRWGVRGLATLTTLLAVTACAAPRTELESEEPGIEAVVVTQWNDATELFLEYPHPVAGRQTGNWAIHLTDMADFQPIRSGSLTVRFLNPAGTTVDSFTLEAPARDGIFLLDPVVSGPGVYDVRLELASPQVTSAHTLSSVRVFASLEEAPLEGGEEETGGVIAFLKEQQWVIPFAVSPASDQEVRASVRAPAEVVPPDGAMVQVSAPVDAIAPAAANRVAPSVGTRVREGQILAVLAPAASGRSFAEVRAQVEELGHEVERAERLAAAGAIPERRLEEARRELSVAEAELDALGGATATDYTLDLRSQISGVVARRDFVPGGRVTAGVPLFTVVDPSTAWLRVHLPVGQAGSLAGSGARFTVEGSEGVHEAARLLSVGTVVDAATRTVPVVYEVAGAAGRLTFGQIAEAAVPLDRVERGIAVPESAVLDDNGAPVAYVQVGGEEFERRALTLGPSDGERVIVRSGIASGEMVVVTGGYQVRLASLSGNEFAGGHAH
ncbi:MAG TPA: efflux RND transporter periplasmic adaptor subunit [Longimicrobiales bacterium]|nr:efflux RND transporter periplasmic adaptor subunit [Longimicrobiales bacterium]